MMKRYLILAACIVMQMALGGLYAWSEFAQPLHVHYGLSMRATQMVFGLCIAVFTLTMIGAGRRLEAWGPARMGGAAGLLFAAGYLVASFSGGRMAGLALGIGLLAGAGTGLGYVCPLTVSVRWFPERKGLVTGLAVAGFGGGAILLANIARACFDRGLDTLHLFRWVGLAYGAAIVAASALLSFPASPGSCATPVPGAGGFLAQRGFRQLFAGMLFGTFAGLLVIGNLKGIGLDKGLSDGVATLAISALALGNALGRIAWGWLSDRLRERAIPLSLAWLGATVLLLGHAASHPLLFTLAAVAVGLGFGACFVVYAAALAHRHGPASVARLYPWVFLAYGLAGITGPLVGGWIFDVTRHYAAALWLAGGLALLAAWGVRSLARSGA